VLDVPSPTADQVMAVRQHEQDDLRMALPVEITVTGSTGVGEIVSGQDPARVYTIVDQIAAITPPIEASFGPVRRVPQTAIFVLTLTDERPFHLLHHRFAESGIQFHPSPYPYAPHCTLRSRSPISEEEAARLLARRIDGAFVLTTLSVYMLDRLPCTLLHRVALSSASEHA